LRPENLGDIKKSFTVQAENFENANMHFSKQQYLDYMVRCLSLNSSDIILEAACGTCVCGRAAAPYVQSVSCLDVTPAMLAVGKNAAQKSGLKNMQFIEGIVEDMPFAAQTFDAVLTRLSFHHFTDTDKPFREMDRVLKRDGKLAVIDMEAAEESLRETEDHLETLRDPSHVRTRSKRELTALYGKYGYEVIRQESTVFPVALDAWFDLTKTPDDARKTVTDMLTAELNGGPATGFRPYLKDGALHFEQRWLMLIGIKES
jgi:ubiquinone/menaquinone biosynthesis C-methylase UbiE